MICSYFRIPTHTFTIWLRDGVREGHLQRGEQERREEEKLCTAEGRGGGRRRWEGSREEGGQGRRDQVQLMREEVTGREALGVAERGGALSTVLVKLYYLMFGFSQGH